MYELIVYYKALYNSSVHTKSLHCSRYKQGKYQETRAGSHQCPWTLILLYFVHIYYSFNSVVMFVYAGVCII